MRKALDLHTMKTVDTVAEGVGAGRIHADEVALNHTVAVAEKVACEDTARAVPRNDIAGAGGWAADSTAEIVHDHRGFQAGSSYIAASELAAWVSADEISLDYDAAAFVLRSNGGAAKVVNHQSTHRAAAGTVAAAEV